MVKKILIGVIVLAVIVAVGLWYANNRNRTLSPPGKAELSNGDLTITIPYSRPSVRGRVIFGTKEQGALQPYGAYWRLGANEATEVTFSKDVTVGDQLVKAGTYRIYAIPGAEEFEIIFNTELGKWGAFEPDHSLDILHVKVPVEKLGQPVEQYTISLHPTISQSDEQPGIEIIFEWADVRFRLPVFLPAS